MSPSRKFIPSDVGTCSSLMPLSSTNATAGFTLEQKKMSQGLVWSVLFQKLMTVEEWVVSLEKKA